MKLSALGEFGLIDILTTKVRKDGIVPQQAWPRLLLGIGDDAAVWTTEASTQLLTTDTMVQGVHFTLDTVTWEELGWKALAVNLSDIAAMGGLPRYAVVTLAVPGGTEVEDVVALYQGMLNIARRDGVAIVGGDTVGAPLVVITVCLLGDMGGARQTYLTRSAAVPGDQVALTGYPGCSAAWLKLRATRARLEPEREAFFRKAHFMPSPRQQEGRLLLRSGVGAAIDVSDGVVSDLTQVCKASGVGAWIRADWMPLHPWLVDACGQDALELALSGGEDYELLFTARSEIVELVKASATCPIAVIGGIVAEHPGEVTVIGEKGASRPRKGWEHFVSTEGQPRSD